MNSNNQTINRSNSRCATKSIYSHFWHILLDLIRVVSIELQKVLRHAKKLSTLRYVLIQDDTASLLFRPCAQHLSLIRSAVLCIKTGTCLSMETKCAAVNSPHFWWAKPYVIYEILKIVSSKFEQNQIYRWISSTIECTMQCPCLQLITVSSNPSYEYQYVMHIYECLITVDRPRGSLYAFDK